MILLLIAILSVTSVTQGSVFNLTLDQPSYVVLDECMYFEDTLTTKANLSKGTYEVYVTHKCEGTRFIYVYANSSEEVLQVEVVEAQNPAEELAKLDDLVLNLKKRLAEVEGKKSYLESLVETLNSINVELYDRLKEYRTENERLQHELETTKLEVENCTAVIDKLRNDIDEMEQKLTSLESTNARLSEELRMVKSSLGNAVAYLDLFRSLFFFTLAFLVGTYFALMRR